MQVIKHTYERESTIITIGVFKNKGFDVIDEYFKVRFRNAGIRNNKMSRKNFAQCKFFAESLDRMICHHKFKNTW